MPVAFAPGVAKSESIAVRSDAGELTAGQLEIVKRHAGGSIAEAICYFYANLPALATRTWMVDVNTAAPRTDLRIDRSEPGSLVLANAILAVRLPDGNRSPAAAAPLLALRGVDKVWRGSGRMEGPQPVKGPVVAIESAGPVCARVRLTYEYEQGGNYEVTVELRAGEEAVMIHERSAGVTGAAFVFNFDKTFDRGYWNAHSPSLKKLIVEKPVAYQNFPIDYQEPSTSTLVPFFSWSLDTATWFAVHSAEAAIRDWLGFFCSHTDAWRGGPSAGLLVETGPEGLRVRAPLEDFERYWGIVAARSEDALVDKDEETNKCFQAQARLAQTPLDRVRKMALEWERPAESYRPHLLLKSGDLSAVRQRARSEQEFRRLFAAGRQPPEQETDPAGVYLATGDEAYAKAAKGKTLSSLKEWIQLFLTQGYVSSPCFTIMFTRPFRRAAVDWDLVAASQVVSDGERRWADAAFAFLNEEISDPNYWPSEERGFWEGPQNFTSDHYSCVAAVACLLDRHPRRDEWLVWAQDRLNAEFVRWSYPGGAWEEAPNYQCATMLYLVPMIRMLRLNGYTGFREAELFKATMRFLGDIQTPYDPRRKTAMLPTVGDTTFSFHSQSLQDLFAWAAHDYSEDAEFAARMMWHWRQGGALMCGVHDGGMIMGQWASALMMVDPDIAPAEPPAAVSRRMDGYGVKLCQKNADGEETYLLIKCGPAKSHYHPDELSFHYYGRGTPLALDYGSMYIPRVNQPWYHNRISIDHKMDAARGNIADFVVLDAADYFAGEVVIDSVTEVPELPDAPYTRAYEKPWVNIRPAAWTRQIMLSRGGEYFAVADTIASDLPTDWSLHVLATGIESGPNMWRFRGQLGTDLEVYSDAQPNQKVATGVWSYGNSPNEISTEIPVWRRCTLDLPIGPLGETQHYVRLFRAPGKAYRVLLLPRKPQDAPTEVKPLPCGFSVRRGEWREWVLLNGEATAFDDGPLAFRGRAALVREGAQEVALALHSGDRLRLGALGVEGLAPIMLVSKAGRLSGISQGRAKQVIITWPKTVEAQPQLLVDGRPHSAAYTPILDHTRPAHQLVFDLREGEHAFEIRGGL